MEHQPSFESLPGPGAPDSRTLDQYIAGTLSAREQAELDAWLAAHPDTQRQVNLLRRALATVSEHDPRAGALSDAVAMEWGRRMTHRGESDATSLASSPATSFRNSRFARGRLPAFPHRHSATFGRIIAPAAALAALVAFGVMYWSPTTLGKSHVYTTATGQRATLSLANGTRVVLAPGSKLAVHEGTSTVAQLTGEALFDVAANSHTPFIVQTGSISARVLGTTFDVRRYPTDAKTRVTVTDGKVFVSAATTRRPSITLTSGTSAVVDDSTAERHTSGDVAAYTAWTDGYLIFDRAPVAEVLGTLERWYGYKFRLADPAIASRHVTATIEYRAPNEALTTLQRLLNLDLSIDGDSVTLSPRTKPRPTRTPARREAERTFIPITEVGR